MILNFADDELGAQWWFETFKMSFKGVLFLKKSASLLFFYGTK